MLPVIFGSAQYWSILLVGMVFACHVLRARFLDFRFMILLVLIQYVAASTVIFGPLSNIGLFCIFFAIIFILTVKLAERKIGLPAGRLALAPSFKPFQSSAWVNVCRYYILFYYSARLIFYPFIDGALLLDQRLGAQQENPFIFYAGLAVVPAFAACMTKWIRRINLFDALIIAVAVAGLLGSGSKAVILPLVFLFFGVMSYYGIPLRTKISGLLVMGMGSVLVFFRLALYFPGYNFSELLSLFFTRIVANTDSLEYLYTTGADPREYPYSGISALFPTLSKQLGYTYDYSPGVWLHGMRFGDWTGFGPNPGPVMDYFGNLGWAGVFVSAGMGMYLVACERRKDAVGVSFISIASLIIVDLTLFEVAAILWSCVLVFMNVVSRIRNPGPHRNNGESRDGAVGNKAKLAAG